MTTHNAAPTANNSSRLQNGVRGTSGDCVGLTGGKSAASACEPSELRESAAPAG